VAVYRHQVAGELYDCADLRTLLAKASPARSGDQLAGLAAGSDQERIAAQMALAEVPLRTFLNEAVIDYDTDEVTRLIIDRHDAAAFAPVSHLTVGDFRDWLLSYQTDEATLSKLAPGLTPLRAGLEDHFCGKLLGLPMGCDVCNTNHAEADEDDLDVLLTLLGSAGCNYIMGAYRAATISCSAIRARRSTTRCTCGNCSDCGRRRSSNDG
jgi:ethanolamine ammonia-lyase large subunit